MANQKPWQAAWNKKNIHRRREWFKAWTEKNRDKYNFSKAKYRIKLKLEVMRLYCDPVQCVQCGFNQLDGLEMDHINDDGAEHRKSAGLSSRGSRVSGGRIYELIRKNGKIEGLQVLCSNCNRIKQLKRWRRLTFTNSDFLAQIEAIADGNHTPKQVVSASLPTRDVESPREGGEKSGCLLAPPLT